MYTNLSGLSRSKQSGITLVELMVVIVIIGILMTVAVPSYRQYMLRANRTDAKTELLKLAAAQEKNYLQNNTYTTSVLTLQLSDTEGTSYTSEYGHYTITVTEGTAAAFTATATPKGGQVQDTDCAVFAIDGMGRTFGGKTPISKANNNDKCWGAYE